MEKSYLEQFEDFKGLQIVAIRNRTQKELQDGVTIDEVRIKEKELFSENGELKDFPEESKGIWKLINSLMVC